jgi:hypothetical protein
MWLAAIHQTPRVKVLLTLVIKGQCKPTVRLVGIFALVGVILSIVGATKNSNIAHGLLTTESKQYWSFL